MLSKIEFCTSTFQVYGFSHVLTLNNLEKVGLLKVQGQRTYPTVRKSMRLIVEEVNEQVTFSFTFYIIAMIVTQWK